MTTRLEGTLRREISVDGEPCTITLTSTGLKLVPKGRRKGLELNWNDLLSGEHALAVALNASLEHYPAAAHPGGPPKPEPTTARKRGLRVVSRRQAD